MPSTSGTSGCHYGHRLYHDCNGKLRARIFWTIVIKHHAGNFLPRCLCSLLILVSFGLMFAGRLLRQTVNHTFAVCGKAQPFPRIAPRYAVNDQA